MSKAAVNNTAETRMIALADLRVAEWNARKTIDLETLAGLTESLKLHGVQVPLIVRPLSPTEYNSVADVQRVQDGKQIFEIIAGHRRFKAAAILKLAELPCIVRELDDAAAREIGLIDNLQREDVPAMEEAEAFGELLDRLLSIAAVAARVGKEQGYVAKRLKLRTCTEHTRLALVEQLITVDHALLLARLGADEQNAALKWCLDRNAGVKVAVEKVIADRLKRKERDGAGDDFDPEEVDLEDVDPEDDEIEPEERAELAQPAPAQRPHYRRDWEPESVLRLKEHIECETGTPLDRAPWPMGEDWLVPDAGSCMDCPQNTKANAPLFGDLDMGIAICTDGGCFKAKTEAFVLHGIETAKKSAPLPILRVSWKATSTPPRLDKETGVPTLAQVFKQGQWDEATKKCEHQRAAVTVDWKEPGNGGWGPKRGGNELRKPGEIVQVCIEPKCKVHPKLYGKAAGQSGNKQESWEERRAREEKALEAYKAKEMPVRRALYDAIVAKMAPVQMRRQALLEEANASPLCRGLGLNADNWQAADRTVAAVLAKAKDGELDVLFFHSAFGEELLLVTDESRQKDRGRGKLRELARLAGVDAAAIERKFDAPAKAKPEQAAAKPVKKTPAKKIVAKKAAKKGGGR